MLGRINYICPVCKAKITVTTTTEKVVWGRCDECKAKIVWRGNNKKPEMILDTFDKVVKCGCESCRAKGR